MLSKEELAVFLTLIANLQQQLGLSDLMLGRLLGVSHTSIVRWMRVQRGELDVRIYRHIAGAVTAKVERMRQLDAERGLFTATSELRAGAKVSAIRKALEGRIW